MGWLGTAPAVGRGLDEIAEFAAARADPGNPRHRLLSGFVDFERAEQALGEGDRAKAITAIDRACALGDEWRFFRERAAVKRQIGDQAGRLADLERANAIRPGVPWVLVVIGSGRTPRGRVVDPRGYPVELAHVLLGTGAAVRGPVASSHRDGAFEAVIPHGARAGPTHRARDLRPGPLRRPGARDRDRHATCAVARSRCHDAPAVTHCDVV